MKPEMIADKLGELKAKLADLKRKESELRDALLEHGLDVVEGKLFRVKISHCEVARVDYKTVAMYLEPSKQLLTAHTNKSERTTFRISAKMGVA